MKDKIKICNICKLTIDERKEFARFTHFKNKKERLSEAFYHINCFREKMSGNSELKKLQQDAKNIFKVVKEKLDIPEVVEL